MRRSVWAGLLLGGLLVAEPVKADIAPSQPFAYSTQMSDRDVDPAQIESEGDAWDVPKVALGFLPPREMDDQQSTVAPPEWRPLEALGASQEAKRTLLAATVLVGVLALVGRWPRRGRRGWRWALVLVALAPLALGFGRAHQHLERAHEGLALSVFKVPRRSIFRHHAQLARDALAAGAAGSVPALLVAALALALSGRKTGEPKRLLVVPAAAAVALLGAGGWVRLREEQAARKVSQALAALGASGAPVLAQARWLRPVMVPDGPLLLVGADGAVRYDDSRGQEPPGPRPTLLPFGGEDPSDVLERPPFFVIAIDGATTWQTVLRALEPLDQRGYRGRYAALLGPLGRTRPGERPTAPVLPLFSVWSRYRATNVRADLRDDGLHLEVEGQASGSLAAGCSAPGPGPAVPSGPLALGAVQSCLQELKKSLVRPDQDLVRLQLVPSPTTPWREVVLVRDAAAEPTIRDDVEVVVWLSPAEKMLSGRGERSRREQAERIRRELETLERQVLRSLGSPSAGDRLVPAASASGAKGGAGKR